MAQIIEEIITIKISRIIKDGEELSSIVSGGMIDTLETVAQSLVEESIGKMAVVEAIAGIPEKING